MNYSEGDCSIDGVPGTGAPILMNLLDIGGGATGKLFPTGNRRNAINGLVVSIVDAGNLTMLFKEEDLGLTGVEDGDFFDNNKALMEKIETTRLEAGLKAGLGDVSGKGDNFRLVSAGLLRTARKIMDDYVYY